MRQGTCNYNLILCVCPLFIKMIELFIDYSQLLCKQLFFHLSFPPSFSLFNFLLCFSLQVCVCQDNSKWTD